MVRKHEKTLDGVTIDLVAKPTNVAPLQQRKGRPVGSLNKQPYGTTGKGKKVMETVINSKVVDKGLKKQIKEISVVGILKNTSSNLKGRG